MTKIIPTTTTSSTREKPCSRRFPFFMGSSLSRTFQPQGPHGRANGYTRSVERRSAVQETPLFVTEQLDGGTGSEQWAATRPQVPRGQLPRFFEPRIVFATRATP